MRSRMKKRCMRSLGEGGGGEEARGGRHGEKENKEDGMMAMEKEEV